MKKKLITIMICIACIFALGALSACKGVGSPTGSPSPTLSPSPSTSPSPHVCDFVLEITASDYLKSEANCTSGAVYYKVCECGEMGTDTFVSGGPVHEFDQEVEDEAYLKVAASSCESSAVYYKSCECGAKGTDTFTAEPVGHNFDQQKTNRIQLRASAATCESPAVWYYSCICGKKGTETFTVGDPTPHEYEEGNPSYDTLYSEITAGANPVFYETCKHCGKKGTETYEYEVGDVTANVPYSITMSIYSWEELSYGYNWITRGKSVVPVVQVKKGASDEISNYPATATESRVYEGFSNDNPPAARAYIHKANVPFEKGEVYSYRIYDLATGVGSEWIEITTVDPDTDAFSFAYITDTQDATSGSPYVKVVYDNANIGDFQLHGGDIVESSKLDSYWKNVLDNNAGVFTKKPIMLAPGNHDTTYKSFEGATADRFNNNLPSQTSTDSGYYYSFEYGNAKFVMVNTNERDSYYSRLSAEQYNWIEAELASNTKDWLFVVFHEPIYSADEFGSNGGVYNTRNQLSDLFAEYGVDVVFQAHTHRPSKTVPIGEGQMAQTDATVQNVEGVDYTVDPNGVIYVTNGPAGQQSRVDKENTAQLVATSSVLKDTDGNSYFDYYDNGYLSSWSEVSIDGATFTFTFKYYDETTSEVKEIYKWGIKKTA